MARVADLKPYGGLLWKNWNRPSKKLQNLRDLTCPSFGFVAQAAKSLALLGDPQQLDQPQRGVHPPGADGSAFDHLLQGRATIAPTQGLFLAETHRLHPDICAFTSELFYEGRLKPRPENQGQRVNNTGLIDGTGIRFAPVAHSGNQSESQEEVDCISDLISGLAL